MESERAEDRYPHGMELQMLSMNSCLNLIVYCCYTRGYVPETSFHVTNKQTFDLSRYFIILGSKVSSYLLMFRLVHQHPVCAAITCYPHDHVRDQTVKTGEGLVDHICWSLETVRKHDIMLHIVPGPGAPGGPVR